MTTNDMHTRQVKLGLIPALVTAAVIAAPAQYVPDADHQLLGFTTSTSTGDLVVDLGTPTSIGVGGSTTVDLIAKGNVGITAAAFKAKLVSLYASVNALSWGVVGGHQTDPTDAAIYSTVTNGAAPPARFTDFGVDSYINTVGFTINGSFTPTNTAVVDPTLQDGNSWSESISPGVNLYCFAQSYHDPDTRTPNNFGTGVNYAREDLYLATKQVPSAVRQGYFTLGSDGSLTFTPASGVAAPSATTLAASSVTAGSATLNASINPNGAATTFSFQYGTNTAYGSATPVVTLPAGTTAVSTNATVTGLQAGKTYHYRVVATNSAGPASGSDLTFTTLSTITMPAATTLAASAITAGTATLNASINPNGAATTFSFRYGTNTAYGSATPVVTLAAGATAVSTNATVTGLQAGMTYHYRVVATNSAGSASGSDLTFTTVGGTPPQLGGLSFGSSSGFQFAFTGASGGSYTAWGTTNVAWPFSQWSNLGPATVTAPGQYQFTDPQATNMPRRYYRVTQP